MSRIVVATGDVIGARMAGPAIRAWAIADALAADHDVQLVSHVGADASSPRFAVRCVGEPELRELEQWMDVLVMQGSLLHEYPFLRETGKVVVADVYDPFHLEQLEQARDEGEERRRDIVHNAVVVLNDQLRRGDFFLCASDKQRDFWLGALAALGRVNSASYDADETLRSLLAVAPFGLPDEPPVRRRHGIRGALPGIGDTEKVLLWGGGIYNWFDPLTLVRAVDRLRGDVRLVFLGGAHPNPRVPEMRMAVAARELAGSLGVLGSHVVFNDGWVPYDERADWLLDADAGVSTHLDHVETAFSFRTRLLDYLWAGLPIVCTDGDSLAALVEQEGLGLTVPAGDIDALAAALDRVLHDAELAASCRAAVARVAQRFHWGQVLAPLVDFCRDPHRAPDLLDADLVGRLTPPLSVIGHPPTGLRANVALARDYLRQGGPRLVAKKAWGRLTK
jgi:glycosyltransferase involved in cell wall biosynthesis